MGWSTRPPRAGSRQGRGSRASTPPRRRRRTSRTAPRSRRPLPASGSSATAQTLLSSVGSLLSAVAAARLCRAGSERRKVAFGAMATDANLRGVYIPIITPFAEDGSVAIDALERLCREYLDAGAAGVVRVGTARGAWARERRPQRRCD